jgi:hypothetical protein
MPPCHVRAAVNFNDGFGGGTNVSDNLIFNQCREVGESEQFFCVWRCIASQRGWVLEKVLARALGLW